MEKPQHANEGFESAEKTVSQPLQPSTEEHAGHDDRNGERARARKEMIAGLLWCAGGLAFSFLSFYFSSAGGRYVVATGAIVWGAIQALKGLFQMLKMEYSECNYGAFWRLAASGVAALLAVIYLGQLSMRLVEGDGVEAVETEQYYGCDSLGLRLKIPAGFAPIEVEAYPETDTTYAAYDIWTFNETIGVLIEGVYGFFEEGTEEGIAERLEEFGRRDAKSFDAELITPTRVVEIGGRQMLRTDGRKAEAPEWVYIRYTLRHKNALIMAEFNCEDSAYSLLETERQIVQIVGDLVFY